MLHAGSVSAAVSKLFLLDDGDNRKLMSHYSSSFLIDTKIAPSV